MPKGILSPSQCERLNGYSYPKLSLTHCLPLSIPSLLFLSSVALLKNWISFAAYTSIFLNLELKLHGLLSITQTGFGPFSAIFCETLKIVQMASIALNTGNHPLGLLNF